MWPVRSRRGTRKRCAALFIVGLCAAIMIITRPFVTNPMGGGGGGVSSQLAEPLVLLSLNLNSSSASLLTSNNSNNVNNNDSTTEGSHRIALFGSPPSQTQSSTSEKTELGPPPVVSLAIKPEFMLDPALLVEANGAAVTEKSSSSVSGTVDEVRETNDEENSSDKVWSSTSLPPPSQSSQTANSTNGAHGSAVTLQSQTLLNSDPIMAAPTITAGALGSAKNPNRPIVYVLTPTFPRMEQMAELTRLGQTLMLVDHLHWLVVDDAPKKSPEVESLLKRTGIPYTYLVAQMPEAYRKKKGSKPKGVANRLAGLKWIKEHAQDNGVMFFADDDNSYDVRLFEEMRWTKKVSMWPVGLVTHLGVSTPVVKNGRVIDFYDGWISTRKFPVDMAGFAVNVGFLKTRPNVTMPYKAGFEEDGFLKSLNITINDIEPKAENCTKIFVWHTKTVGNKVPQKISAKDRKRFKGSNLFSLPHIV